MRLFRNLHINPLYNMWVTIKSNKPLKFHRLILSFNMNPDSNNESSKKKEWHDAPSPPSLEALYNDVRANLQSSRRDLQSSRRDLREFLRRVCNELDVGFVRTLLLTGPPLLVAYDIFLDIMREEDACKGTSVNGPPDDELS